VSLDDAERHARHYDEAAKLGRSSSWEYALDEVDDTALKPAPDCFSCGWLRASDSCGLVAKLALTSISRRSAAQIVDLVEYRASTDPHSLCPGYERMARR